MKYYIFCHYLNKIIFLQLSIFFITLYKFFFFKTRIMGSKIKSIEYYLPKNTITNEYLANLTPNWTPEKIESKIGVRTRQVVDNNETAVDLAIKAGEKALANYDKEKIDFLIFCTQSPDYYLPTSACIIQNKLGLKTSIGAFDFNLACSGYIYGLSIAKGLIAGKIAKNVLFIASETYSKHINDNDMTNRLIFGDGATATIIEECETEHIHEFALGTDGNEEVIIIPNGGMKNRYDKDAPLIEDDAGNKRTANDMYMNGEEVFSYSLDIIPKITLEALAKNNMTVDDIDCAIFHQTTKYMMNHWRRKLKIPKEKFYIDILNTGNTVASSIPFGIKSALDKKIIKKGDKILMATIGGGYSFGALVLTI